MGKFGYLLNKYIHLNKKDFNFVIKDIKSKSNMSKSKIIKDIVDCHFKFKSSYRDYYNYEFYKLNQLERSTYITTGLNQQIIDKNNKHVDIFNDRVKFYEKFHKYIIRDYIVINEDNYEEFKEFTKKHNNTIAKSIDMKNNTLIGKVKTNNKNREDTFHELLHNNLRIVEEVIKEYPDLERFHPASLNTIRIITIKGKIVLAYLQIGTNKNITDNFDEGSLLAPVNIDTGLIDYCAVDKNRKTYERHPNSKENILWFTIPKWPRIKRFVQTLTKEVPDIGYIGWNICLNEKDPVLVSATATPRSDYYQLPEHKNTNMGFKEKFKKELEGE